MPRYAEAWCNMGVLLKQQVRAFRTLVFFLQRGRSQVCLVAACLCWQPRCQGAAHWPGLNRVAACSSATAACSCHLLHSQLGMSLHGPPDLLCCWRSCLPCRASSRRPLAPMSMPWLLLLTWRWCSRTWRPPSLSGAPISRRQVRGGCGVVAKLAPRATHCVAGATLPY